MNESNSAAIPGVKKISRRQLLHNAAAATAFTIVPRHVLGGPGQIAPSEKVNVAIIGTGGQGIVNMKQLFNEPDVHIAALRSHFKCQKKMSRSKPDPLFRQRLAR